MTPEEAINKIEDVLDSVIYFDESIDYELTTYDFEWLETAKEALEKQIPKKAEHEEGAWSICPNCGGNVCNDTEHAVNKEVSHCEHCGQALDWSDRN